MTQQEIKQAASVYNYKHAKKSGYDTLTGVMVFEAFVAGANYANVEITTELVWCIHQFLEDYKGGGFGFVTTAEAIERHFDRYWEMYQEQKEYDGFIDFPSNRVRFKF